MKETVERIRTRAAIIHSAVNQKYDIYDYSFHLNMVGEIALDFIDKFKEEDRLPIIFAAYFHDSIEDARLTYNDVMKIAREYMTPEQAYIATEIVYACTNEKGRTRKERANEKYYEGIRNTPYASFVKLCDRLANMKYSISIESSMAKKYIKEREHFIEAVTKESVTDIPEELINIICQLSLNTKE